MADLKGPPYNVPRQSMADLKGPPYNAPNVDADPKGPPEQPA